jgi:predicted solute-binding protein
MRHLAALARRESQKRQLNETLCYTYFNERMRYDLDGDALKGLKRYLELARQRGLVGPYTDPEELLLAD